MDIFKLFFDHDLPLDQLARRDANETEQNAEATLEDFMRPVPTYSRFYLTGTLLDENAFGINTLEKFDKIIGQLDISFSGYRFFRAGSVSDSLTDVVSKTGMGEAVLISKSPETEADLSELNLDQESNAGPFKEELSSVLLQGSMILYKEQARNGFDLHLFSKQNMYEQLFYPLKELVSDSFRFFSINSKRMHSERHFYFETWTLNRPPHGAEEVLPETVL